MAAVEQFEFYDSEKLSHIDLSKQSLTEPIEGRTPASRQRIPKAIEEYWVPGLNGGSRRRAKSRLPGASPHWNRAASLTTRSLLA